MLYFNFKSIGLEPCFKIPFLILVNGVFLIRFGEWEMKLNYTVDCPTLGTFTENSLFSPTLGSREYIQNKIRS